MYPQVFIKMPLGVEAADRRPVNDQAQQMQAGVIDRVTPALSLTGPSGYLGEGLLLGDPWRGAGDGAGPPQGPSPKVGVVSREELPLMGNYLPF